MITTDHSFLPTYSYYTYLITYLIFSVTGGLGVLSSSQQIQLNILPLGLTVGATLIAGTFDVMLW